jgi:hypothetical protein
MATIDLTAREKLEVQVWRTEDEAGEVTLILKTDEGTLRIRCGATEEDADRVYDALNKGAQQARGVHTSWEDRPHQYDAYVSPDSHGWRGTRWYLTLEGVRPEQPGNGYPDKSVAVYELARAMADRGSFPPAWAEGLDWAPVSIDDEVRAFHDEGGDKLLPLPGVTYEPGTEVRWDDSTWEVVRDYGELGVWLAIPVDPDAGRDHLVPHELIERADLLSEARGWAADQEWIETAEDIADMPDELIRRGIEEHYAGGWAQFARDHDRDQPS